MLGAHPLDTLQSSGQVHYALKSVITCMLFLLLATLWSATFFCEMLMHSVAEDAAVQRSHAFGC